MDGESGPRFSKRTVYPGKTKYDDLISRPVLLQ